MKYYIWAHFNNDATILQGFVREVAGCAPSSTPPDLSSRWLGLTCSVSSDLPPALMVCPPGCEVGLVHQLSLSVPFRPCVPLPAKVWGHQWEGKILHLD